MATSRPPTAAVGSRSAVRFTRTPIYRAIVRHDLHALHESIRQPQGEERRQLVGMKDDQTRFTFLHLVVVAATVDAERLLVPFVYALSNEGVELESRDCRGRTALYIAIVKQLYGIVAALLRVGCDQTTHDYRALIDKQADPDKRRRLSETFDKYSPGLWSAVESSDLGNVYILINSWCRVNIVRRIDDVTTQSLIQWALSAGISAEIIRLLAGYEVTIEFVHAALAGDRERMLQLLQDRRTCDRDVMDISHQDDWASTLRPRSLRETVEAMGLHHVVDLLTPERPGRRHRTVTAAAANDETSDVVQLPKLDLALLGEDGHHDDDDEARRTSSFSRTSPRYQSLREPRHRMYGTQRQSNAEAAGQEPGEARTTHIDHIATPRHTGLDGKNVNTAVGNPVPPVRHTHVTVPGTIKSGDSRPANSSNGTARTPRRQRPDGPGTTAGIGTSVEATPRGPDDETSAPRRGGDGSRLPVDSNHESVKKGSRKKTRKGLPGVPPSPRVKDTRSTLCVVS